MSKAIKITALFLIHFIIVISFATVIGCKPDMPQKKDHTSIACYLADVCIRMPAFAQQNSTDCALALQKCFRYEDYEKCTKEKDSNDCFNKLGIRY